MTIDNRDVSFRDDRFEISFAMLISLFFDKSIKTNKAVFQLELQSLERICQLFVTIVMNICTSLRFT